MNAEIFQIATKVTSPIALIGLVAALSFWGYSKRLSADVEKFDKLPEDQRIKAAKIAMSGRAKLDNLPPKELLTLLVKEMETNLAHSRLYTKTGAVVFVICFVLATSAYVAAARMAVADAGNNEKGRPTISPSEPEKDIAKIEGPETHYKDVVSTIPDFKVLPYTFTSKASEISTFAPSDTGIATHFRLTKSEAAEFVQLVDVEVEVHSFKELPKSAKPEAAYPAGLQPFIIVVALKPEPGIYKASMLYEPLGVEQFEFDKPSHRPIPIESLATRPVEIRESSPQPFIVVVASEFRGVFDISAKLKVTSKRGKETLDLMKRHEFAFVTIPDVDAALAEFKTLPADTQAKISKEQMRFDYAWRGDVLPLEPEASDIPVAPAPAVPREPK